MKKKWNPDRSYLYNQSICTLSNIDCQFRISEAINRFFMFNDSRGLCDLCYALLAIIFNTQMFACELLECRQTILLEAAKKYEKKYGGHYEKFSSMINQTFDKILRINPRSVSQKQKLPLVILATMIIVKNLRHLNGDENSLAFISQARHNYKSFFETNSHIDINRIFQLMSSRITSPVKVRQVIPLDDLLHRSIYDLIVSITETTGKNAVQTYNDEQIQKISAFFGEKLYFINYDLSKDCLSQIPLNYKNVYLLKAKQMYFILKKEQDIQLIEEGYMNHEQLAAIFSIQNKLQQSPKKPKEQVKVSQHQSSKIVVQHEKKSSSNIKANIRSTSQISQRNDISELSGSRLKHSALFPEEITCGACCKKSSEFSAIFWNYSHYCFECVLDPKVDVSFIPSSIIEKFLKSQKINCRQYVIVCSQCRSQTFIANYRPWDKPKNYRCKICLKDICIEHERMINQCFCHCQKCDEPTVTIPGIFVKLCLSCRARFCEICSNKSRVECACICQICGQNKLVDHSECKPKCHCCDARDIPFIECRCGKYLCSICFFTSCQPNSNICSLK